MRGYSKIDIVLIVKEKANLYGFAFLYADKTKTAAKGGWLTRYCNICYTQNVNNDVKQVVPPNIREVMTWSLIPICSSSVFWSLLSSVYVWNIEDNRPWKGAAFPQLTKFFRNDRSFAESHRCWYNYNAVPRFCQATEPGHCYSVIRWQSLQYLSKERKASPRMTPAGYEWQSIQSPPLKGQSLRLSPRNNTISV